MDALWQKKTVTHQYCCRQRKHLEDSFYSNENKKKSATLSVFDHFNKKKKIVWTDEEVDTHDGGFY